MELPAHQVAQFIAEGEEIIPSEDEAEVPLKETEEEDLGGLVREEDFEVFYHFDVTESAATTSTPATIAVSSNQGATEVLEGMVIEKKLPNLLSLLESHVGDATLEVLVVPRPPTPAPPPPPQNDPIEKKRKRDKKVGKGAAEEGEVQEETSPEQTRFQRPPDLSKEGVERCPRLPMNVSPEFQTGIHPWSWIELPLPRIPLSETSTMGGQDMLPTPWSKCSYCLEIWPSSEI